MIRGTQEARNRGTEEPRNQGTKEPRNRGTEEPRNRGAKEPRNRGAKEPRNRGAQAGWLVMAMMAMVGGVGAVAPQVVRQDLQPGGFYVAQVPPNSRVTLNGEAVETGPKGELVVGFDRNAKPEQVLKVCGTEAACTETRLRLKPRSYVTQNVTKVPAKTVEPDAAQVARVKADNAATAAARAKAKAAARWRQAYMDAFVLPLEARTSGVFGSRRTYNGQERSWHKGHDLAAPTGTAVRAPAGGIVRLARDTFMSGNLIMLDHGGGLTSVYAHLDAMDVAVGDEVKARESIGKVGTTGRSSGPHLHWGMYWQNTAIDPILWVSTKDASKAR